MWAINHDIEVQKNKLEIGQSVVKENAILKLISLIDFLSYKSWYIIHTRFNPLSLNFRALSFVQFLSIATLLHQNFLVNIFDNLVLLNLNFRAILIWKSARKFKLQYLVLIKHCLQNPREISKFLIPWLQKQILPSLKKCARKFKFKFSLRQQENN